MDSNAPGGWEGGANPAAEGGNNPSNIPSLPPAQKKEKKKPKPPRNKRKHGANLRNRGGKAAKSATHVTPANIRRSNTRSTAVAAADPDLSSNHSSEEDSHSSGDEETASHKEPRVHSALHKLRRSNASLVSGKVRSKEKEAMYKTQIDDLNSVVGQLHQDRVDKEIVAKDIEESHQAQTKAMDDLHLGAINKLKQQNKDLAYQMSEQRQKSNLVSISFSLFCLLILISILNFFFLVLNGNNLSCRLLQISIRSLEMSNPRMRLR